VNPNLFRSQVARNKQAWKSVVYDGALADNGMIGFKPWLTADQAEAVRAYVITEAARLAKEPAPRGLAKGKTGDKPVATKSGAPPA
jgi:quinohemoprotein ethanol dehydrogenase